MSADGDGSAFSLLDWRMERKRRRSEGSDEEMEKVRRRKRSRGCLWKVPPALEEQTGLCGILFNALRKCKGSEHRNLSDFLMRIPSRRLYPSYYDTVSKPIDLMKIQQKVKMEEYRCLSSFLLDIQLLLDNSRLFYPSTSEEYQQTNELESAFTHILSKNGIGTGSSESDSETTLTLRIPKYHFQSPTTPTSVQQTRKTSLSGKKSTKNEIKTPSKTTSTPSGHGSTRRSQAWIQEYLTSNDPIKMFLAAVYDYHDALSGEFIAEPFHQLPSKTQYPNYYKVITQPMDLATIHRNVEAGHYSNLRMIQDDMIIMIKNAHHFNEPGSEIYKMASALRKFIISRCSELEKKYQTVTKTMTPKAPPKLPLEGVSAGSEEDKNKVPKLKIAVSETSRGQRSSMSSMSDLEETQMYSSEDELFSDEDRDGEEVHTQRKLLLRIKKTNLVGTPPTPSSSNSTPVVDSMAKLLQAKKPPSIKKKLMAVYRSLVDKTDAQGRILSELFMRRPSSKLYPEYYLVIKEPIDLREILGKIRTGAFSTFKEMEDAVELMVNNALTFNEEASQIYSDALVLRDVAKTAITQLQQAWPDTPLPSVTTTPTQHAQRGRPRKVLPTGVATPQSGPTCTDAVSLFQATKNHTNLRGRHVWLTFKQLPAGVSSDYYSVVKKPIDMTIIGNKLSSGVYHTLDQIYDDMTLMTDNAFTYFPSDSQQAQDAIALQRAIVSKYTQLKGSNVSKCPDVMLSVKKILKTVMTRTLSSKESSESLKSVVATREVEHLVEGMAKHSFNLANVMKWMDEGEYCRLDVLQLDLLAILIQASKDGKRGVAVEVGRRYLEARDELCGEDKDQLWSPALTYTLMELESDLEAAVHSQSKSTSPIPVGSPDNMSHSYSASPKSIPSESMAMEGDNDMGTRWEWQGEGSGEECNKCEWAGVKYSVGDVVYVKPSDPSQQKKSHIVLINKFRDSVCFDGTWFYRPEETFHVATRKFYEKEVFRSDFHGVSHLSHVEGKCTVLFVRDYFKFYPKGFADDDVFVCESRYSYKTKSFRKIKNWTWPGTQPTLLLRDTPISMNRVPSVFVSNSQIPPTDDHATPPEMEKSSAELKAGAPLEVPFIGLNLKNVIMNSSVLESTYYEQFCIDEDYFRIGDFVYLRSDQESPFIARIDRMWTDMNGDPWIYGPWFLRPKEVSHSPTRAFYQQELLMSNIQDINPMRSICGRCVVLSPQDYARKRPTGYEEKDVFVFQSRYNEANKEIKKVKGMKHHQLSPAVISDEMFYFPHAIQLTKVASPKLFTKEFNPLEPPAQQTTPSQPSSNPFTPGSKAGGINITPQLLQQLLASASKLATTRPVVIPLQPSLSSFSASPVATTQLNQTVINNSLAGKGSSSHPVPTASPTPGPIPSTIPPVAASSGQQPFPCLWGGCHQVYNGPVELYNHVVGPGPSHISKEVVGMYFCRWRNCPRNPVAGGRPFDTLNKMMRHMREVHLMKLSTLFGIGSRSSLSRVASTAPPVTPQVTPQVTPPPSLPVPQATTVPTTTTTTPTSSSATHPTTTLAGIFLPPPENRQKLVHSDIYLRYIQGIKTNSKGLCSIAESATLRTSQTHPPPATVNPGDWLGSDVIKELSGPKSKPESRAVLDALWALRDHMNKDSWKLSSYLAENS